MSAIDHEVDEQTDVDEEMDVEADELNVFAATTSSPHAAGVAAASPRVLDGERVARRLRTCRTDRFFARGLAIILTAGAGSIGSMVPIVLILGPGPHVDWAHGCGVAFTLFAACKGWVGRLAEVVLRLPPVSPPPVCPACEAALIANTRYTCVSCETTHTATPLRHWSAACPTCRIKPGAAVCWRCRSVIRFEKDSPVTAASVLERPGR